jgi:hypothetical protein
MRRVVSLGSKCTIARTCIASRGSYQGVHVKLFKSSYHPYMAVVRWFFYGINT